MPRPRAVNTNPNPVVATGCVLTTPKCGVKEHACQEGDGLEVDVSKKLFQLNVERASLQRCTSLRSMQRCRNRSCFGDRPLKKNHPQEPRRARTCRSERAAPGATECLT
eukprot:2270774-Rhodomonas_salina.3